MKKHIASLLLLTGLAFSTIAQTIKITTCDEKKWTDARGFPQMGPGAATAVFTPAGAGQGAHVYFKYDVSGYPAWGKSHPLDVSIYLLRGDEQIVSYAFGLNANSKPLNSYTHSGFTSGNYLIVVSDKAANGKVYSQTKFTVKDPGALVAKPVAGGEGVFTVCKDTDDNWNAIGATTTIPAGTCVNFMVKMPAKIPVLQSVGWEIFRITPEGKEEFFNELSMYLNAKNTNRWATTQCITDFGVPGKYRIYAVDWKDRTPTAAHQGEFYKYLAKTDITVE